MQQRGKRRGSRFVVHPIVKRLKTRHGFVQESVLAVPLITPPKHTQVEASTTVPHPSPVRATASILPVASAPHTSLAGHRTSAVIDNRAPPEDGAKTVDAAKRMASEMGPTARAEFEGLVHLTSKAPRSMQGTLRAFESVPVDCTKTGFGTQGMGGACWIHISARSGSFGPPRRTTLVGARNSRMAAHTPTGAVGARYRAIGRVRWLAECERDDENAAEP
ncbi:hypothetical protein GHT06_003783 [Daphnia sinensis]|uniref:Uncharacterized protein n=1 Tax=Daphnia sinensis TaxID=1820382 RepID=A0AAD5KDP6_9CRUS|nr:hypothetical protein GHT06_003783 [Daphnia sinensis]